MACGDESSDGTYKRKVIDMGLDIGTERGDRLNMMALDEAFSSLSIVVNEAEVAHLTEDSAMVPKVSSSKIYAGLKDLAAI